MLKRYLLILDVEDVRYNLRWEVGSRFVIANIKEGYSSIWCSACVGWAGMGSQFREFALQKEASGNDKALPPFVCYTIPPLCEQCNTCPLHPPVPRSGWVVALKPAAAPHKVPTTCVP